MFTIVYMITFFNKLPLLKKKKIFASIKSVPVNKVFFFFFSAIHGNVQTSSDYPYI